MSSAEPRRAPPRILCTGIIVLDEVFRVDEFPQADGKVQANGFFVVNGGCAANAAVAIARLGGRSRFAGPLGGPAGLADGLAHQPLVAEHQQVDVLADFILFDRVQPAGEQYLLDQFVQLGDVITTDKRGLSATSMLVPTLGLAKAPDR